MPCKTKTLMRKIREPIFGDEAVIQSLLFNGSHLQNKVTLSLKFSDQVNRLKAPLNSGILNFNPFTRISVQGKPVTIKYPVLLTKCFHAL